MKDPYTILGVSRDATDEDIKKAYRTLARKYHPDNYAGSDLAELAEEKMKEINEAYDLITKMRTSGSTHTGESSRTYTSGNYAEIRYRINEGRYSDAEILLDAIPVPQRGAEWNFLKGAVCYRRGWMDEAKRYYETAVQMQPNNMEYRRALQMVDGSAGTYRPDGYGTMHTTGCGSNCSEMCLAWLCCSMFGGGGWLWCC